MRCAVVRATRIIATASASARSVARSSNRRVRHAGQGCRRDASSAACVGSPSPRFREPARSTPRTAFVKRRPSRRPLSRRNAPRPLPDFVQESVHEGLHSMKTRMNSGPERYGALQTTTARYASDHSRRPMLYPTVLQARHRPARHTGGKCTVSRAGHVPNSSRAPTVHQGGADNARTRANHPEATVSTWRPPRRPGRERPWPSTSRWRDRSWRRPHDGASGLPPAASWPD